MLANAFIQPGDAVIEFGARYGTTSCILSRNVGMEGHVISVEPDVLVHGYLLRNRYEHGCNFHAVLGTVSNEPLFPGRYTGYAGQTTSVGIGMGIPHVNVSVIEQSVEERINVALIDCEGKQHRGAHGSDKVSSVCGIITHSRPHITTGCIPFVDKTGLLDETYGVDLILMEEDAIDYSEWHLKLQSRKYKCVWYIKDTYAPNEIGWSQKLRHSAWAHERILSEGANKREIPLSCEEYVKQHGFTSEQIDCSHCPV